MINPLREFPEFCKKHSEKIKFLIVGGWNTLFGYLIFIGLYYYFPIKMHYMLILVLSNILSITNAYISYKCLVFKTKGNYLAEYLRFYGVYGSVILLGLAMFPFMVEVLHFHPILAQTIMTIITVCISYFGHKHFSFKPATCGLRENSETEKPKGNL